MKSGTTLPGLTHSYRPDSLASQLQETAVDPKLSAVPQDLEVCGQFHYKKIEGMSVKVD